CNHFATLYKLQRNDSSTIKTPLNATLAHSVPLVIATHSPISSPLDGLKNLQFPQQSSSTSIIDSPLLSVQTNSRALTLLPSCPFSLTYPLPLSTYQSQSPLESSQPSTLQPLALTVFQTRLLSASFYLY